MLNTFHTDGEFGPVYQSEDDGLPNWQEINESRFTVLKDQLEVYKKANASWSIWLYKDIGFQGMTYVSKDTPYMKLLKPFLEKKKVGWVAKLLEGPGLMESVGLPGPCRGRMGLR